MNPDAIAFTDQQSEVVEKAADSRTVVVAPAGTGKTEVLIARIRHLVQKEGLSPGREILILSFSRSAVGEITRRVGACGGPAGYTSAATFDSFATRLLSISDPGGTWLASGYDGRIEAATRMIEAGSANDAVLGEVRHVLVDEIQDLVGVRRELVGSILESVNGGFTLLGDPAQAIYDWQEDSTNGTPAQPILEWLERRFEFETIRMEHSFRPLTDTTRSVIPLGAHVGGQRSDPGTAQTAIGDFVRQLPHVGSVDVAKVALRNQSGAAAILCRTNGQALTISKELHQQGIDHRLQRKADDRAISPWVARLVSDVEGTSLSRRGFEARFDALSDEFAPYSVDEAWRLVSRLAPGNPAVLDLNQIGERIRMGAVPDELSATPHSPLVVSTIHRSKGLEFDRVFLVEPEYRNDLDAVQLLGELRVTYVGLSRARRHVFILSPPDTGFLRLFRSVDRWAKTGWKKWQRFGIEVRGSDVEWRWPAEGESGDPTARELQDYLVDRVHPGDPVELHLEKAAIGGIPRATYSILHDGRRIGVTSEEFARDLFDVLKVSSTWKVNWPARMNELRVEMLDTVAGGTAAGMNAGLGPSGIWLRPRIAGLANLIWKDDET